MIGLWVGVGGALGAIARFALAGWVITCADGGFPWGTFAINLLGSAALGFLHRALPAFTAKPRSRAFFTVGLCGGFTTFSTFDFETLTLLQAGRFALAGVYSLGSVLVCILGVLVGGALASSRRRPPVVPRGTP